MHSGVIRAVIDLGIGLGSDFAGVWSIGFGGEVEGGRIEVARHVFEISRNLNHFNVTRARPHCAFGGAPKLKLHLPRTNYYMYIIA